MRQLSQFLAKRFGQGVFVVWGVITAVFVLRGISPTNPAQLAAPTDATAEQIQQIAEELGLTRPIYEQYFAYLIEVAQGDLGYSYITSTPVAPQIFGKLGATIELAVFGILFALVLSIPLGVISSTRRNEAPDYVANLSSLVGVSTPNFWLAIMLVLLLSVQIDLLPTSGRPVGFLGVIGALAAFQIDPLVSWVSHMVLPTLALGTYLMALMTRLTRSGMIEELSKPYVQTNRAKGLPEVLNRYKHALRNSLAPVVTVVGLQLGRLIGGSVVIESVFAWPGIGSLFIRAVNTADWPIIQGTLIVVGIAYVLVNIGVDLVYAQLDPQVVVT
ncbi:ABC transporter permease [Halomicroarcula sp. GCM10025324]|uniref:ABC transporter permease n=1 Tax=Haloarcula TaxID=2237 RepID=UPI0023E818C0|nr:ABC transporter permease [Halomicroarcula sp. ZS-22-S1]